jgi:methionyl-tRNA formyltransferase
MPRPRVVVFGYGELAVAGLETLERMGVEPAAVVIPGNRRGPDVDLVADYARTRRRPALMQPHRHALSPFLDAMRKCQPELLFVWSYSMMLPPALLAMPRLGAVNIHGGLLPEYRGGHVMNWAIANGELETGATLAYLDEGIDTGPVIAETRFPIEWADDAASVREKLRAAGQALLERWWPAIEAGTAPREAQDESRARYHRMRTADDGRIDWATSSARIRNLVRALVAPWPGAFTMLAGTKVVVRRVQPSAPADSMTEPGTVIQCDDAAVRVGTGDGAIELVSCEIDGSAVDSRQLRRAGVTAGARFMSLS